MLEVRNIKKNKKVCIKKYFKIIFKKFPIKINPRLMRKMRMILFFNHILQEYQTTNKTMYNS